MFEGRRKENLEMILKITLRGGVIEPSVFLKITKELINQQKGNIFKPF